MPLDPALESALTAAAARGVLAASNDHDQAVARQRDGAAFDMRALGAAIGRELAMAPDAAQYADLNTASRIPTTLEHPAYVPGTVQPQAPAGPVPAGK